MLRREFKRAYGKRFGPDWVKAFTEKIKQPYHQFLRVNTLKTRVSELIPRLEDKGFELEKIEGVSYGFKIVEEPFNISSTPEYLLGYFYLQDKASMLTTPKLEVEESDEVLDCCSAPGGKTSHLAQLMNNKGVITAVDDKKNRLKSQLFNLQRLGVKNVASFKLNALNLKKLGKKFNKILLDAPCSATGTVWRKKNRLKSVNKHMVKEASKFQKKLLKSCYEVLERNGLLLYSTCSLEREENEENVEYAEYELGMNVLKTRYFFPQTDDTIGFFHAVMRK